MVVAQVCHGSLGGSTRAACRLANALAKRGHAVHTISYGPIPWALDPTIRQHVLHRSEIELTAPLYRDWRPTDRQAFVELLARTAGDHRFDILHYHYALPFASIVRQALPELRHPLPVTIGTLHGTDLTASIGNPQTLTALNGDLSATDALTTVSRHMLRLSRRALSANLDIAVLPNFVEDDWPNAGGADHGRDSSAARPAILHVSNFRAAKDVSLLARLFLQIRQRTDAELWLVGDGPEMPALRRRLQQSSAAGTVRYLGVCRDPAGFFTRATLLASTSTEESFGLSILEAMASGLPVVATAVGGVPELVRDDETGLLFDPQSVDGAADRVGAILASPTGLTAMRRVSLERARPLRETPVVPMYEGLYREKLAQQVLSA